MTKRIFVFGSNLAGIHGAGAARVAFDQYGAKWREGVGPMGNCYAIPTKDATVFRSLTLPAIECHVNDFLEYAREHDELVFQVTCIGCGLAGFKDEQIAPLFKNAPYNCLFDFLWKPYLGDKFNYWGTSPRR